MAINFPSSPVDGQLHSENDISYRYNTSVSAWLIIPGEVVTFANTGSVAPLTPVNGSLWWNTEYGRLLIYYTDVDSSQWVDVTPFTSTDFSPAFNVANAAFNAANNAVTDFSPAFNVANAAFNAANNAVTDFSPAFNVANGAYVVANAAFNKANNAGYSLSSMTSLPTGNYANGESYIGESSSIDVFGVLLIDTYNLMDPIGRLEASDFGTL